MPLFYTKYLFSIRSEDLYSIKLFKEIILTCNILMMLIELFLLKLITETIYLITKASKLTLLNTAK